MPTILDTLGVQMCTISYGKEASFAGKLANVTITVTPMAAGIGPIRLNWAATGDIFSPFSDTTSGDTGAPGIIALPRTDQDGFRHGTSPFKNWYYKAAVVATLSDGQQLARSYQFQTTSSTLDLDLLDEDSVVTALPVVVGPGTEPAGLSDATRAVLATTYPSLDSSAQLAIGGVRLSGSSLRNVFTELMPAFICGDSYTKGGFGADDGTRYWDRVFSRLRTLTPTNVGVAGTRADQILMNQIVPSWTPGRRGLVGFGDVLINDVRQFATDTPPATTIEAFRSCLVYLTAKSVQSVAGSSFVFGPGWTSGNSSTANSYVDIGFSGDTAYLLATAGAAGGVFTITNSGASTPAQTITTNGYLQTFTQSVKLSGYGTGNHSVRVKVNSGTVALVGIAIPGDNPPTVVWFQPGPYTDSAPTQQTRLAAYIAACAALLTDFPTVLPITVESGWDNTIMLATDGLHPNDRGHAYIADRIEKVLRAAVASWRQGLHYITSATSGGYAPVAPTYSGSGATAPSAPTGATATAGNQAILTWTRATDGGATLAAQPIQASSDGGTTWNTVVANAGVSATTYTITSGLTASTSYIFRVGATNSIGTTYSTATSAVTAGAPPVTYSADTFSGTGAMGNTETGGYAWSNSGTATVTRNNGTALLSATGGGDTDEAFTDGQANGTWSLQIASTISHGMLVRRTSVANGWNFYINGSGKYVIQQRTSAGAFGTAIYTSTASAVIGDIISVIGNGSALTFKVNGATVATATDAGTQANGGFAFWCHTVNALFGPISHTNLLS